MEVFVFRNKHAIVLARELPDALITGTASAEGSNVQRIWKEVVKQRDQLFGELLVEEQAHDSRCGNRLRSSLPLRRVGETRPDVFAHQLRKILEDLIFGRPCCKIPEHVTDGNPSPTHTRLPEAHLRIDADSIEQAHDDASLRQFGNDGQSDEHSRPRGGKPGGSLRRSGRPSGTRDLVNGRCEHAISLGIFEEALESLSTSGCGAGGSNGHLSNVSD
jgi:hypothetical protein